MPAKSRAQQAAISIAEHNPNKLNPENKGLLNMTHEQMHEFASTSTKGLPLHVPKIKQPKIPGMSSLEPKTAIKMPRIGRRYYGEKI